MTFMGPLRDCSSSTDFPDRTKLMRQMVGLLVTLATKQKERNA